jgi:hypothetical protein
MEFAARMHVWGPAELVMGIVPRCGDFDFGCCTSLCYSVLLRWLFAVARDDGGGDDDNDDDDGGGGGGGGGADNNRGMPRRARACRAGL